ncbi:MAG: four helix bundle protein [Candidatus Magasanikbacteria bacterium]|nr:four helix bundle protein [Candidatus Magasanikbacteria bacterium]
MDQSLAFQKTYEFYKELYTTLRQISKRDRFTWGERCETMALDLLRAIAKTNYAAKMKRRALLTEASDLLDMLKLYIRLGHDLKIINPQKYLARQAELQEIGKLVGGWLRIA